MTNNITVNSAFDGGNIIWHSADAPNAVRLKVARDTDSEFLQWFYFRVCGGDCEERLMIIENAGACSYPQGWEDYQALASYDRETWFRIPTSYKEGKLTLRHKPTHSSVYYAYFAPFSMQRHADLIAKAQLHDAVSASVLGHTLDGQAIDLLTIGSPAASKLNFWVIARQHPGETMAEWWMEGFLQRLLTTDDAVVRLLRDQVTFYVVPNMNPDGSRRGHLRTNAIGVNLNREWDKASEERSPEVFHVLQSMQANGVDFALDVHGDEGLPYVFIAGADGVPGFTGTGAERLAAYRTALVAASPDFQTDRGYPPVAAGRADLSICTNYIVATFRCLAMTLEMPFKDNANRPDAEFGWSPERCRLLGAANVQAMHDVLDQLR